MYFYSKYYLSWKTSVKRGNNDLSSVKNCTGDDAEKFKVDIERKINS